MSLMPITHLRNLIEQPPGVSIEETTKAATAWLADADNFASEDEIATARRLYAESSNNDIEIDDGALASRGDDGTWVQAWVWLATED